MGFSSTPDVRVCRLPDVLLFGKMDGGRREQEQSGDTAGICTDGLGGGVAKDFLQWLQSETRGGGVESESYPIRQWGSSPLDTSFQS